MTAMEAITQAGAHLKTARPEHAAATSVRVAENAGFREAMQLKLKARGEEGSKRVEKAGKGKEAEKKVDDQFEAAGASDGKGKTAAKMDVAKAVASVGEVSLPAVPNAAMASVEVPGSVVAKSSAKKVERIASASAVAKKEESGVKVEGLDGAHTAATPGGERHCKAGRCYEGNCRAYCPCSSCAERVFRGLCYGGCREELPEGADRSNRCDARGCDAA